MKNIFLIVLMLLEQVIGWAKNDDKILAKAQLKSVTVFFQGAELVHSATVTIKQGNTDIVIDNVSNSIDESSIQVKIGESVTILSVSAINNYLDENNGLSERAKQLRDSVMIIEKRVKHYTSQINDLNELKALLKANKEIKGSQNGLSVAELIKLIDYYKLKNNEISLELEVLNEKIAKENEILQKIKKQLEEEKLKTNMVSGKILINVQNLQAGTFPLEISYISQHAKWEPYYDIRMDDLKKPLRIVHKAYIFQTTGLDWKQIKLSLSSATPGTSGHSPTLNAWFLDFVNQIVGYRHANMKTNVPMIASGANIAMDVEKKEDNFRDQTEYNLASTNDNNLNISYDIDIPFDVPCSGKAQSAVLKTSQTNALLQHLSIPKLDKEVYLIAKISDWEQLNLLPGMANILMEGTFTGKTFINPGNTQDTFSLTLGFDKRVVVKREKLQDFSSIKFLGSNKQQKFIYEITLKNNKKDGVNILLKDQFPISTNKEIEIEMLDDGNAVKNTDTGTLQWDVKLSPNESKKIKFSYSVKYPKDKKINL